MKQLVKIPAKNVNIDDLVVDLESRMMSRVIDITFTFTKERVLIITIVTELGTTSYNKDDEVPIILDINDIPLFTNTES